MYNWIFWIIIAVIFAIVEIATPTFFMIWFSVSALIISVLSIFITNITFLFLLFVIIAGILVIFTKPLTEKFTKSNNKVKTNYDHLIGKVGIVTQTIMPLESTGRVKVNNESWKATSFDNSVITQDSKVCIENIDGVTLIVKPVE